MEPTNDPSAPYIRHVFYSTELMQEEANFIEEIEQIIEQGHPDIEPSSWRE